MATATAKSVEQRFWSKVRKTRTCWLWMSHLDKDGYWRFWYNGKAVPAHRFAYEIWVGPIPEGLTIDHKCRIRHCVRPFHLEPVTNRINILRGVGAAAQNARKTHCINDHELTGNNVYTYRNGRDCRTCARANARRRYYRLAAAKGGR